MQHMYTAEDQLAALRNAGRHMADGGVLALDVFNPRFDKLLSGDGEEHLELEWPAKDGNGGTIRRYFVKDGYDPGQSGLIGQVYLPALQWRRCTVGGSRELQNERLYLSTSQSAYLRGRSRERGRIRVF